MRKFLRLIISATLFLFSGQILAQDTKVSGSVIAQEDNSPLQGVTVTNRTTNQRTLTNSAGYYSLNAAKGNVLVFTYVGYARQELTVGDSRTLNLRLVASNNQLGEVIVTAYDIKRAKRDLTYQAITVKGDEIASTRRDNFINSLAGRIPGAMITSTSGMPGSSTSIILRGPTSIDGSNQPIFVVDGLIVDNSAFEMKDRFPSNNSAVSYENIGNDFRNRGADINPEDIESVTILKGPEATALYGSDGANGAIIVTTKKGKKGKASVAYNGSVRWEKVYRFPEEYTAYDQGNVGGYRNQLVRTYFGPKLQDGIQKFDNVANFFKTGITQQHNLSVDGGNDLGTYRFTASYINQDGVVPKTGFKRYNFRLNTTFKLSPKFNLTNSFSYIQSHTDKASRAYSGSGGFLLSLLTWPTTLDARLYQDSAGNKKTIRGDLNASEDDNPFWDVNKNPNFDDNSHWTGNFQVNFDATKWLNLTALMGVDYYNTSGTFYYHPQSNVARTVGGIINQYRENQRLINGVFRGSIRKKLGDFMNTIVAAFTFDNRKYDVTGIKGERMFDPNFASINNADPVTVGAQNSAENYNRFGAFINYSGNFKNWWNFSLSARMDASSRLIDPLNYKFSDAAYLYSSAGTAVIFTDAFKLPKWIEYGKARFNYATTGRDPRAAYVKGNKFSTSTFTGGGFVAGTAQGGFTQGNPSLRPEYTKQLEAGTEMKFLHNRLGIDVAYYDNRTVDQLIALRLSYASGAILEWVNGGTTQNKGIEAQITATPIQHKNFNWDITVNFARNRNKILEMPVGIPFFYNSDTWQVASIRGQSIQGGTVYQLAANRYQRNINGDIVISTTTGLPLLLGDYTVVGDRQPDFTVGLINSLTFFKDWNLAFNLDIRKGGDVYNGTEEYLYRRGLSKLTADRETPRVVKGVLNDGLQNTANPTPNNIVITPLFRSDFYTSGAVSEQFIERNIDWIRMRDITLSYNVSKSFLKRQKLVKAASIFVTGTDLFLITNYSGADPSTNANNVSARSGIGGIGMDFGNLATPRGINVGLRAQF
ncbi:MAG: SusC/RagA family TonB-linked outer membrane protein [Bacteroidota bacterium]|nr:SusC/RagA family TonB-linked outer membrane protein [Bacteroidota bacterium]